jgi:hypothetical protein
MVLTARCQPARRGVGAARKPAVLLGVVGTGRAGSTPPLKPAGNTKSNPFRCC